MLLAFFFSFCFPFFLYPLVFFQEWYFLAKTLAEEAAWKFAKENDIDLVAIHPGMVIGPFFQPILNFGAEMILNLLNGNIYSAAIQERIMIYE